MKFDPYQFIGAEFLASKRFALLADDMGLGKTAQTVLAADMVRANKILVICPAVARVNWKREFNEFSIYDREFVVCYGSADWPGVCSVVSYDYATEHHSRLIQMQWDLIIIDESHFVKEPEAKRTVRIYGKDGIIRKTQRFWALSGTPAPNHAGELWPMLFTFGVTNLAYDKYVEKFCNGRVVYYGGKPKLKVLGTKKKAIPEIKAMLSKVMLRRLKEEVLKDLPPIKYVDVTVEPGNVELVWEYVKEENAVEKALSFARNDDDASLVLEGIADSVATLRRTNGLQKVHAAVEIVTHELNDWACDKIVIFAYHTEVIDKLKEGLKAFNPVVIRGGVSHKLRQEAIDNFQNDKDCRVFIGNILAAGTAITLTASCQVLFVEQDWVPGNNAQAAMRCHRRGQTRPVFVRCMGIADSIDEKISSVLRRKSQELTQIFDSKSESHLIGE